MSIIQEELGLPFATEKAVTLASNQKAQAMARKAFGPPDIGRPYTQAKRLGGDHSLQLRPAKKVLHSRHRKYGAKLRPWRWLRGTARRPASRSFFEH